MFQNIARAAVLSVPVTPFDVEANLSAHTVSADKVLAASPDLVLFGELSLCGASCGALLRQKSLLQACLGAALRFAGLYSESPTLFLLGLPLAVGEKVISAQAVIKGGRIALFAASRRPDPDLDLLTEPSFVDLPGGHRCPVLLEPTVRTNGFLVTVVPGLRPTDPAPTGAARVLAAPTVSLSDPARDYRTGADYASLSAAARAGLIVAAGGMGESSYKGVYKPLGGIFENGSPLAFQFDYEPIGILRDLDLDLLPPERALEALDLGGENSPREVVGRPIPRNPFLSESHKERVLDDICDTQIQALCARMRPNHLKKLVVGVSGGIDSAHALLVAAAACDRLGMDRTDLISVRMPGPGSHEQSRSLAERLCRAVGSQDREIDITEAVHQHFKDISHDSLNRNATYENAQARERTQILFDIAGDQDALVVGTGDLSEIALGWCTFGGDHLSGYNVNASLTKSLVTACSQALARRLGDDLPAILEEIAALPPSPELLPGDQKTQDALGPYELHDFFLYYFVRHNLPPEKIIAMAVQAWRGTYEEEQIRETFETFRRRFLTSQFKRGCAAEGALFGPVCLSPLRRSFPSDLPTVNF